MSGESRPGASPQPPADVEEEAKKTSKSKEGGEEALENSEVRPPLPPRPSIVQDSKRAANPPLTKDANTPSSRRPQLQSKPTTALSSIDIQTLSFPDGSRGTFSTAEASSRAGSLYNQPLGDRGTPTKKPSRSSSEVDETNSIVSYAPTLQANGDLESLLAESLNAQSPAWKLLNSQSANVNPFETVEFEPNDNLVNFENEFLDIGESDSKGGNEEELLRQWKGKLKHYMILSSAGKPIYSRHGDLNLINRYIGIIQTIISFYQGADNPLRSFTAGSTRFVISIHGPLYLLAISKLGEESESQLRAQLDALYTQILSTLTLPTLTHLFAHRPSTDLRRPLEGTEPLLDSLADSFTRGSPSALLSALECLPLRPARRAQIDAALLRTRSSACGRNLLYGLVVAGGRLVSVARPKRHSLHPGDLQLIFNMLFEAGGVKAGGGENWIPLCLPGFNNRGYLYMYVSFLNIVAEVGEGKKKGGQNDAHGMGDQGSGGGGGGGSDRKEDEVAILLISADKESFFELRQARDDLVDELEKNGSMDAIRQAVRRDRPSTTDLVPGTQLRHFLYKSRANVQFMMPSFSPHFNKPVARRR